MFFTMFFWWVCDIIGVLLHVGTINVVMDNWWLLRAATFPGCNGDKFHIEGIILLPEASVEILQRKQMVGKEEEVTQ